MVAFGKKLRQLQVQEWQSYYINYKLMKKRVKQYVRQVEVSEQNRKHILGDFSRILDKQIEKTVLFLIEQEGMLSSRLLNLGEQRDALVHRSDATAVTELREAYRNIGRDLLKLLSFLELNAVGLRKILKKFDKRFGYKFTNYYVKTRASHPYSQLGQVLKHVGISAVVGTLSRNLADLKEDHRSYISIYDQPALSLPVLLVFLVILSGKKSALMIVFTSDIFENMSHFSGLVVPLQDPIIEPIKSAVDRLMRTTDFLQYLGKYAFIPEEELPNPSENDDDDDAYHLFSLLLNLANAFLYMVNTYIIVPTADTYALSLGAAATACGVIIGSMAIAQVFSSVYFSAWSNRSYVRPLVFSSIVLFVGNTLYALAYDLSSIYVLLIGRLFCGLGSARAVNRRYITDCVPLRMRMKASAGFVSASALGMACGPGLACLLQTKFKVFELTFNEETLPGWVMALAWLVYLLLLLAMFQEPSKSAQHKTSERAENGATENEPTQPLLMSSYVEKQQDEDEEDDQDFDDISDKTSEQDHKPVTSIVSAYKLLTPCVKVQLLIYFMLKYAVEVLLAESSVITSYYFVWSTRNVAIFLACLGTTVLPVNVLVGSYFSNIFEERQVMLASEMMVCIGIILSFQLIIPYSVPQYVCSALLTFVAAEVLEGVNLSLLSRVMSSRLSKGTYNGGLLSTEAGTLARVFADGTITLAGYWGMSRLLNATLLPSLIICIGSIIATCFTYNSLY